MIRTNTKSHFFWILVLLLLIATSSLRLKAQLAVSNTLTPVQLVQNILLGSGVTATNITYNGAAVAIGQFNGSSSNIGLSSGVIMTSGNINNAVGPNNQSASSFSNNRAGDPDMDQVMSPSHSFDAAILEFDFVPLTDTIRFRYAFGSEEYMEFVSANPGGINDAFGFFISGPGITGTFSNGAKNIALIPGTALPVTMYNLNLNNHGSFYIDNGNGLGTGTAPNGATVQYDGFTVPLVATTHVVCGQTYHIKLAISDGGDHIYDSGVFLEAGSFSSVGKSSAGPDINFNLGGGCSRQLNAVSYNVNTTVWNSVYPGATGAYNSYLSCTSGCLNPTVTPPASAPTYVDFQICGVPTSCASAIICDTVRVFFTPPIIFTVTPQNPVLCVGQASTTLTANASGGVPPYTYLWNNVNPAQSITVGSGVYTVKLVDASGCQPLYATTTVTTYTVPIVSNAGLDQTVCKQSPTTSLNGTVTGATGGAWSGGNGVFTPNNASPSGITYTPTAAELATGYVDLTLTSTGNGVCAAVSDVMRINYVNFSGTPSVTSTPVSCFGNVDGTATVNISGGIGPFTYSWNSVPAQTTATASNLVAGTYTVTTKNTIGCTLTNTIVVTQPSAVAISPSITNVSCPGATNGSISLGANGGVGPYTYLWLPGNITTTSLSNKPAGTYTVTVTDSKLCPLTSTFTIIQPNPINVTLTPTNVTCNGGTNGSIISGVTGGTPPYVYTWGTGQTSPNLTGLSASNYSLFIKDSKNCPGSASVIITQPSAILANVTSTNETCSSLDDGTAFVNVSGGTPGYSYLWQPGAKTSTSVTNLAAGITYTLTVTDSLACPKIVTFSVTQPSVLAANFTSQTNVSCNGGNNGSVKVNPSGGTAPYTYTWTPSGATTNVISNLVAGTYSVTLTDAKGCSVANSVIITQPNLLTANATSTNKTCNNLNNGKTTVVVTGGTAPYTYSWVPGGQTTSTATGLNIGTYTVTVKDSKGCLVIASATVAEPTKLNVSFTSQQNVTCGNNNGSVTASPTGGTPGYTYLWTPGNTTAALKNNLAAGTYTVTVKDAHGCTATNFATITQPSTVFTSVKTTKETCSYLNNGTATAQPSGGVPGYTYLWQPGGLTTSTITNMASGTYTLTVADSLGCTSVATAIITQPPVLTTGFASQQNVTCFGASNASVNGKPTGGTPNYTYSWAPSGATTIGQSNLPVGTYSLTITDANGCVATNSVTITQPLPLTVSTTHTNETCDYLNNGTATAIVSGGTPAYTYSWSPSAKTTQTATGLTAGTYTVIVKDSKGCKDSSTAILTQPTTLTVNYSVQNNVNCNGGNTGKATAIAAGGTPGYSYSWSPGGVATAINSTLSAGTYTVTATDASGCAGKNFVTITQPSKGFATISKTDETCSYLNNGTASAQPSGGTPGYTYLWQPGAKTTSSVSNLSSGTYTLSLIDTLGCITTTTAIIAEPAVLTCSFSSQQNVSCFGATDASVNASPTGGTPNYTYLWTPGGLTTNGITNLSIGTYSLTVTDANGCVASNSVAITQPNVLTVSTSSTNETCDYLNNGTATANVTGGTAGYTYFWIPSGQITATAIGLAAGSYSLTVQDAHGCIDSSTAIISQPTSIVLNFTIQKNVSCNNGTDGSAIVAAVGGVPGYTYLWMPGGKTTATNDSLSAGTYTVTATDASGCSATNYVTITQPSITYANITKTDETCNYLNNGTATAVPSGGTPGYTYLWQPGAYTTSTISNLASGTYSLTLTDSVGCISNATVSIAEPVVLKSLFSAQQNVSCLGGNDASVHASPTGGTPNYSYLWMPGAYTNNGISNLSAGTYSLTVTDANGCIDSNSITITQPSVLLTLSTSGTNVTCYGGSNGTASALAAGGGGTYTYLWFPGNLSGSALSNLSVGTYSVTLTDSNHCVLNDTVTLTQAAQINLTTSTTNTDCGLANGKAKVIASNGVLPYSYLWTPSGSTNDTATALAAGAYSILVTDSHGCTLSKSVSVSENSAPSVSIVSSNPVSCYGGSNGAVRVHATGGLAPYIYSWTPSGGTDSIASGLTAGTYTVTVKGANGCQTNISTGSLISQPDSISIAIADSTVTCFNGNNGFAGATITGGVPGYAYSWSPGGATTAGVHNLTAGSYTVLVTDTNSCIQSKSVSITQPSVFSVALTSTAVRCFSGNNGTASAFVTGGNAPYSYVWMPGNISGPNVGQLSAGTYTLTVTDENTCSLTDSVFITQPIAVTLVGTGSNSKCSLANGQASVVASGGTPSYFYQWAPVGGNNPIATGLQAGSYTVTVIDNIGCINYDTIQVNDDITPSIGVSAITNVTCNGFNNGTATVNVVGGTAPFTYLWSPSGATTAIATGLTTGTHTVVVTDANGCQSIPAVSAAITEPNVLIVSLSDTVVSCFGGNNGSASSSISGGTSPYAYLWSPTGGTTSSLSNLTAAIYTLQVTDANHCLESQSVNITQPTILALSLSSTPVSCFGGNNGTASSVVSGGTTPYSYVWMPGNISGPNVSQLSAGTYTLTIVDANGCSLIDSVNITQPTIVSLLGSSVNSNCSLANGQASVNASGGTPAYTYQWAPTGGVNTIATGLYAGSYTVTVVDVLGCTKLDTIVVNDNATPTISVSATTNVTCNGFNNGTAAVNIVGGAAPFTYLWSPSGVTNAIATGLTTGTHTIVVTDANNCQSIPALSAVITEPNVLMVSITDTVVNCFGGNNGSASSLVSGGTPGYAYFWSPGGSTNSKIVNLTANTYTLQVTDTNSCVQTQSVVITEPTALSVVLSSTQVSCFSGNDGTAAAVVSGGAIPYTYLWMPGNIIGSNAAQLSAGTYTLNITDANGCTLKDSVTIIQPTLVTLVGSSVNSTCSFANGQAAIIAAGGTPAYVYQWAPTGGTNALATGLFAGSYTVTVVDNLGCSKLDTILVSDDTTPTISVSAITDVTCYGANNGTATPSVSGGRSPFTYLWSPSGATTAIASGLTPGTHTVVVTDANGCQSIPAISATINEPNAISIVLSSTLVSCFGGNDGTATGSISGGTPGYTYLWSPGGNTNLSISNLTAITYTLQVTDTNSCVQINQVTVQEPPVLGASITSVTNVYCYGDSTGTATVTATGGTPSYSYSWLPSGGGGATGTGLYVGSYTVTVTDNKGCNTTSIATITQPLQALSASSTSTMVSCFAAGNGAIGIHPTGGTAGYSYVWNPFVSIADTVSNLVPGIYSISIADTNACKTSLVVEITEPPIITGSLSTVDQSCNLPNGSVTSQINGGVAPYTYFWQQNAATTYQITGLVAGTYNLQVTDAQNCIIQLAGTIGITPSPIVSASIVNNVSCTGGNDGKLFASVVQGTPPFAYNWIPYGGNTENALSLDTGTYIVNVIDALGCQTADTMVMLEPTVIDVSDTVTNVLCNGGNTGSITLSVSGGTGPNYTYAWLPTGDVTPTASNLVVGTYTATVTDQNGCVKSVSVDVAEPLALIPTIDTIIPPVCFGGFGAASVIVSGGISPYYFVWSPSNDTTNFPTNLLAGNNTVTCTDANGCIAIANALVNQPLQVITVSGGNDTICLGQSVTLSATATGGSGNYYYAWQPSGAINSGTLPMTPTGDDTYYVVAFDQTGCQGVSTSIDIKVYTLDSSNIKAYATTPICLGNSSDVFVETFGNTGPLSYTWSNGLGNGTGLYSVTPTQNTSYVVTITNSCGLSTSDSVMVYITPPPVVDIRPDSNVLCTPGIMFFTDSSLAGNPNDPITSWIWDFGDGTSSTLTNPSHVYSIAGIYQVTLTVSSTKGCVNSNALAPVIITGIPSPTAAFSVSSTQLQLPIDILNINNQTTGASSYNWTFGDGGTSTLMSPQYLYSTIGVFQVQLIAMAQNGCLDTATLQVTTDADVVFPTAFTPGPDGSTGGHYNVNDYQNDIFFPYTSGVVEYKLEIYDRWGELIFMSTDIKQGWDGYYRGVICQQDVYVFKAYVKLNNGKEVNKIGNVTLLR